MRTPLPARRTSVTVPVSWRQMSMEITFGLHPVTGKVLDAFVDMEKGGDIATVARDAAVLASLALQYGAPPEVLAKSMLKVPEHQLIDGEMFEVEGWASPVGAIVGVILRAPEEMEKIE